MISTNPEFVNSKALDSYVELLLQLHRLISNGKGDTDDANVLRDHMDVFWNQLDAHQLQLAGQLSEDLYNVFETESEHPRGFEVYSRDLAAQLSAAKDTGDALSALRLLSNRPNEISFGRAMLLRGVLYRDLGLPEIGLEFINCAAEWCDDPESAMAIGLVTLAKQIDAKLAVARAIELFRQNRAHSFPLKFVIAGILLEEATKQSKTARKEYASLAKDLYVDMLRHENREAAGSSLAQCFELLSHCYYLLGQTPQALRELANAIRIRPIDEGLYVQSGLIKLDSDFASAKQDFVKAANLGSPLVWPYYYLAFDALLSENYERSLFFATEALSKAADLEMQGKLHSWIAMSLGSSSALTPSVVSSVRNHFKIGMMLAPANETILLNSVLFENTLSHEKERQAWTFDRPLAATIATEIAIGKRLSELASCN